MKLKILIICLLICPVLKSQNFSLKEKLADKYYNRYSYYKAIPMYEQLLKVDPRSYRIHEKLADSYRKINDSENAEMCYSFLVDTTVVKPEYYLFYAQALARNGKYEQSQALYQKYSEVNSGDNRGAGFSGLYKNLDSIMADSADYSITSVQFNSPSSDFSPSYFGKNVVFVSARKKPSIIRSIYNRTYSSYLDLYMTDSENGTVKPFSRSLNSIYHEGPVTFTKNQDTIIFTRSNYYKNHSRRSDEGINKLKLFEAEWDNTSHDWTNIKPLPFNNDQYSVGHPAFSGDGKTIYFASDKPGSIGGTDIYCSHIIKSLSGLKTWSEPENLGSEINTRGNEMFPFADNDGNLWYASDGLPGLGGLDVFFAASSSGGFSNPVNAGANLNSRFDDFGYITNSSGREGYFSSDRNNEIGDDDIFSVIRSRTQKTETPDPVIIPVSHPSSYKLTGKVYSADSFKPIPNSTAFLLNKADSSTIKTVSDESGTFTFDLKPESDYTVNVTVINAGSKCSSNINDCSTRGASGDVSLNLAFPVFCVGDVIKVENIYYDLGKYNIRPDARLELDKVYDIMLANPKMKIELRSHTDSRGTPASNMILSDRRANAAAEYLFSKGIAHNRITGKGFGDTLPLNNCIKGVKCTEDEYKINRRTEFKVISLE